MSIVHDAYLFDAEAYLSSINRYLEMPLGDIGQYTDLREEALNLYRNVPHVSVLCSEYGGWDWSAVRSQIPEDEARSPADIAFWLLIMLFSHLTTPKAHEMGLGPHTARIEDVADALGWDHAQRDLVLRGRPFVQLPMSNGGALAKAEKLSKTATEYLRELHPFSTGGHAGWLSREDADNLARNLPENHLRRARMNDTFVVRDNHSSLDVAIQAVSEMLHRATESRSGLCVFLSG